MGYIPGDTFYSHFTVRYPGGGLAIGATDYTAKVSVILNANTVYRTQTGVTWGVVNSALEDFIVPGTVSYATGTIPSTVVPGDRLTVVAQTTIDGNTEAQVVDSFLIDEYRDYLTGTVTTDPNSGYIIDSALDGVNDLYSKTYVIMLTGALRGVVRKVDAYDPVTTKLTVDPAFPFAPAQDDRYKLIGRAEL